MSSPSPPNLAGTAAGYAFLRSLGYVASFATTLVLAFLFGKTAETDALFVALLLPYVMMAFAHGSVPTSVVTVVAARRARGEEERARGVARAVLLHLLLLGALLAVCGVLLDKLWVQLVAGNFAEAEKVLTARYVRWASIAILFTILLPATRGILHSYRSFLLPAVDPLVLQLTLLVFLVAFGKSWGVAAALAGTVAGFGLSLLVQWLGTQRHITGPASRDVGGDLREMRNLILALIFIQFLPLLQMFLSRNLASVSEGAISALAYSERLLTPPAELLSVAVGSILLPTIVAMQVESRGVEARGKALQAVTMSFLLLVACNGLILAAAEDIIRVIFQRGAFLENDTKVTGEVFAVYSFVLPAAASFLIIRILLAERRFRVVLAWMTVVIALYVPGSLLAERQWGVPGIAGAIAGSNLFYFLALFAVLLAGVPGEQRRHFLLSMAGIIVSAGAALAATWGVLRVVDAHSIVRLGVTAACFLPVFYGLLLLLRVREAYDIFRHLLRRGKRED